MNIIYVGALPPQHLLEEIKQLGSYLDFATYTFQNALVSGLDCWYPQMRVVSSMRVDTYPKVKKVFFHPESYSHKGENNKIDRFIGVVNFPVLKRICSFFLIRHGIKQMLCKDDENIVIIYSMPSSQLLAVASLKKCIFRSCLVVPDLPEFMTDKSGWLRRIGKAIDRKLINWSVRRIDTFALLSKHMSERLPIEGKMWIQMEGLFINEFGDLSVEKDNHKVILYTGTMGDRYGIDDLIRAFSLIDNPNYRLWIRGNGATSERIQEIQKKDSRVVFWNPLPKKNLLELLQKATVLVNPVTPSQEFTRYFFPSKTMEYLASGTPVVMYHLDCMPKEYDKYIFYIENESVIGLKDKLVEVCEMDANALKEHGIKARDFILSQKNAKKQTERIVNLINSDINERKKALR